MESVPGIFSTYSNTFRKNFIFKRILIAINDHKGPENVNVYDLLYDDMRERRFMAAQMAQYRCIGLLRMNKFRIVEYLNAFLESLSDVLVMCPSL